MDIILLVLFISCLWLLLRLHQQFSKCVPKILWGAHRIKTVFKITLRCYLPFSPCWHLHLIFVSLHFRLTTSFGFLNATSSLQPLLFPVPGVLPHAHPPSWVTLKRMTVSWVLLTLEFFNIPSPECVSGILLPSPVSGSPLSALIALSLALLCARRNSSPLTLCLMSAPLLLRFH